VRLSLQLRDGVLTDPWLQQGEAMGLTFSPLIECNEILAEAHAMQNCADQYADRLARDKCRLFSVRRRGQRVATLEIGSHVRETGMLTVTQLKARQNMPAAIEVWQAAHSWLSQQPQLRRTPPMSLPERPFDNALWQSMIIPYRDAQRGAPWLPEIASASAFSALDQGLADLARRGGVSSWLFT
jgi:PcfJ-like protein